MADELAIRPEGRPTVFTEDTVQKLIDVFRLGVTDKAAIAYAKIGASTFYTHYAQDEEFRARIEEAKHYAVIAARQVVVKAIVQDKDLDTSKWYIEKHDLPSPAVAQTQVNVFNMLRDKYTKKNGEAKADVVLEVKHE